MMDRRLEENYDIEVGSIKQEVVNELLLKYPEYGKEIGYVANKRRHMGVMSRIVSSFKSGHHISHIPEDSVIDGKKIYEDTIEELIMKHPELKDEIIRVGKKYSR